MLHLRNCQFADGKLEKEKTDFRFSLEKEHYIFTHKSVPKVQTDSVQAGSVCQSQHYGEQPAPDTTR